MTVLASTSTGASTTASGFGPAQWSTIIAALIAALVAVTGYMLTQAQSRRERRAREFADALAAVEEYLEVPYRIRWRSAATPEAREAITALINSIQTRIVFHLAWLQVETPAVGQAYAALVSAARSEAGKQMSEAGNTRHLYRMLT